MLQNPLTYGYHPQRLEETQQRYETQQQTNANATESVITQPLGMKYFATTFENLMLQQTLNNGPSSSDGLPNNQVPTDSRVLPEPTVEEPNMLRL